MQTCCPEFFETEQSIHNLMHCFIRLVARVPRAGRRAGQPLNGAAREVPVGAAPRHGDPGPLRGGPRRAAAVPPSGGVCSVKIKRKIKNYLSEN